MKLNILLTLCGTVSLFFYSLIRNISFQFTSDISYANYPVLKLVSLLIPPAVIYLISFYITKKNDSSGHTLKIIVLFSILFRLMMIGSVPVLENDFNRYIWDGKVFSSGVNPYEYAPDADVELYKHLKTDIAMKEYHSNICYPDIPTVYPAAAEYIFLLGSLLSPKPGMELITLKLIFFVFDIMIVLLIISMLGKLNLKREYSIVYAWSPLVIMEFGNSAHMDPPGIFFLVLALYFVLCSRKIFSLTALSIAFCVKIYPLLALPFFLKRFKLEGIRMHLILFLYFMFVTLLLYIPFIDAGYRLFTGFITFSSEWKINDSVFTVLAEIFKYFIGNDMVYSAGLDNAGFITKGKIYLLAAKGASGLLVIITALILFFRKKEQSERDFLHNVFVILSALFIVSPVQNPWYFCWLVPFLCFFHYKSFITLSCLLMLYYPVVYIETCGKEISLNLPYIDLYIQKYLFIAFEYIPFYILLLFEAGTCFRGGSNKKSVLQV